MARTILSQEEIIARCREIHGDKYDYSETVYKGMHYPMAIRCPKHGVFYKRALSHIFCKQGCPMCSWESMISKRRWFGTNDMPGISHTLYETSRFYYTWRNIMDMCSIKGRNKVCDEWMLLSSFKKWHDDNYRDGFVFEKDLMKGKTKLYSPETCCYLPKEVRQAIHSRWRTTPMVRMTTNKYKDLIRPDVYARIMEIDWDED